MNQPNKCPTCGKSLEPMSEEAIATVLANQRGMRRGAPSISNVLDMLPDKIRNEFMDDARAILARFRPAVVVEWPEEIDHSDECQEYHSGLGFQCSATCGAGEINKMRDACIRAAEKAGVKSAND